MAPLVVKSNLASGTPTAVSVRLGAGVGGSDRVEITWATGAIKNTWLEVNVHAGVVSAFLRRHDGF